MAVVMEEADESLFWLGMISQSGLFPEKRLASLLAEANVAERTGERAISQTHKMLV